MKLLALICCLLALASTTLAGFVVTPPYSTLIPLDFYETVLVNIQGTKPLQGAELVATFDSTKVRVDPASYTFPANQTTFKLFRIYGQGLTDAATTVTFTGSLDQTGYNGTIFTTHIRTITACGVVNAKACNEKNAYSYLAGNMKKAAVGDTSMVNVTIQTAKGYDAFANTNTNCPADSSFVLRVPLKPEDDTQDRLGMYFVYPSATTGDVVLPHRIALKRRDTDTCSVYSVVMFDGNQDGTNDPALICDSPLANVVCENSLLPWQIAVIVVGVVVGVVLIGVAGYFIYKKSSGK